MNIALFGGSFDPPHDGHFAIASAAREQATLAKVIFLPCRRSPHKSGKPGASGDLRLDMLRAELSRRAWDWAKISDFELHRPQPSFSWQSVEHFKKEYPQARLFWLLGADQWLKIANWARADYLAKNLHFLIFRRENFPLHFGHIDDDIWQYSLLGGVFAGSSTEARTMAAEGEKAPFVSEEIWRIISQHNLYNLSNLSK